MALSHIARLICVVAVALVAALGAAQPSLAQGECAAPDCVTFDLPAGLACEFDLRVKIVFADHRQNREFKDKNGYVRTLSAGKGDTLTFTNMSTNLTLTLRPNGSVQHTVTNNADGTSRNVSTGHTVLILFPTDVPAGPSTKLYVGQVTYTVDAQGNFALQKVSGTSTDICAALGG